MRYTNSYIQELFDNQLVNNLIVRVGNRSGVLCDIKRSSENRTLTDTTLFDMASLTKIVATTSLFFIATDRGLISSADTVSRFFDVPEDKSSLTVGRLLTHTMGIGHKSLLECKLGYENVQDFILNIPSDIPIGSDVRYSCPGYILLGRILEKVLGGRLDMLFLDLVAKPLGMQHTCFLPSKTLDIVNSNVVQEEVGTVNDYNSKFLGGVCGNAGLFSCLKDIMRYINVLLSYGEPLFSKNVFLDAIKNHTPKMSESRGHGFIYVDEKYEQVGSLFPSGSIGHCGYTGQSLFVDVKSGLYAVILSDATLCISKKYGFEDYEKVKQMRRDIHAAIEKDIKAGGLFHE